MKKYDSILDTCRICKSNDVYSYHYDYLENQFYKCNSCGVQFMNPQYTDEYLNNYYSGYTVDGSKELNDALTYGHKFYMSLIERFISNGDMLDFGSGNGILADVAKNNGWNVEGYDVDCDSTSKVSKKLDIPIYCGDITSAPWKKDKYDLITMHQVLEHLKEPNKMLEYLISKLKRNGLIFIAVPNIKSLSSRIKFRLEKAGLRKERIGKYYDSDHHLFYFTPRVLEDVLVNHGFEILYKTGCHKVRPNDFQFIRNIKKITWERLMLGSAFLIIARKQQ